MKKRSPQAGSSKPIVRCAIYTRKSTEEGLQQEFNSLDAQREAGEAYIASQRAEGWVCLPNRYDDGGFTGGNMDRPALRRLMTDIEAGSVDCVVVYKVDRLSRSLMNFARMMETFERHNISFVSVTQHFNTTHSMGRLTLNILLSFAQFEREIISERTRDKIAAARRRGKFSGGRPVLGYDILGGPTGSRLVVNEVEAGCVRAIFELYLTHEALLPTVAELNRRGWTTKRWTGKAGADGGGRSFDKTILFRLLTNVLYAGKLRYRDEVHVGEHAAVVDEQVWQRVQAVLQRNGRTGGGLVRNKHGALLKGLLRCAPCGCSMGHSYTSKAGKRYRYYVCVRAQKRGWNECPSKSVPAGEMERIVVDWIRSMGKDPAVLAEALKQARGQREHALEELCAIERTIQKELQRCGARLRRRVGASESADTNELAGCQEEIAMYERRANEVRSQFDSLSGQTVDEREIEAALLGFDPVWQTLSPREQARILRLLVERIDYDGGDGSLAVTFRPCGIKSLAEQFGQAVA